ncbi:MAG TPA: RMD1 family protein, partial [Longimicrobiales bacterium]|nr:RMD1 family protein [Longimicrobiales bacterium]
MTAELFADRLRVGVRAHFLAERLEPGRMEGLDGNLRRAALVRLPQGCAVVFRYGAVVTFGLSVGAERNFLEEVVRPALRGPLDLPEREEAELEVSTEREGTAADGAILVADTTPERLAVVAEVLARSTVLAHYEGTVADA